VLNLAIQDDYPMFPAIAAAYITFLMKHFGWHPFSCYIRKCRVLSGEGEINWGVMFSPYPSPLPQMEMIYAHADKVKSKKWFCGLYPVSTQTKKPLK